MKAEGILMHRERNVIAVRAPQGDSATVVQVLDLAASAKLVTPIFWAGAAAAGNMMHPVND